MKFKNIILILTGIILGIVISIIAINVNTIVLFINNNGGVITLLSIFIAIIIFLITKQIEKGNHIKNQHKLLQSLLGEINALIGRRNFADIEMGAHLEWIRRNNIYVDNLAHKIDSAFYSQNLDYQINDKKTKDILTALKMLEDKIDLINFYVGKKRGYVYELWKKSKTKDASFDDWVKNINQDKYLQTFNGKLESPLNEAERILSRIKCILEERFKIK